ncbi:ABC transporter permease [Opitutus sp. ER46]|uniref:ABC transporter permease n=1 Tax=Opitutus sp. ER46 TaxID=2161864 RepID=UPI000D3013AB|nr:ABC transporter permease [Opitutus sp. ER46]PTX90726.1 permease [Opitutus sp. ER46]
MHDLRFAVRQLFKSPGFTAVVVLSLALGIAANATVLAWLQRFVLHPLPGVADQEELVVLVSNQGGGNVSLPDLRDFTADRTLFAGAFASMPTPVCLTTEQQPEWLKAQVVTANFFDVLGVRPLLGRTFLPQEDQTPSGNFVLVISERLWRRRFAAAPDIVGRVVDLNRQSFTIVGVVPDAFDGSLPPARFDLWAPASMITEVRNQGRFFLTERTARGWHNLVRLQPGVSLAQARAAVAATEPRLQQAYPKESRNARYRLVPLTECPWGGQTVFGPTLRLLLAVSMGVQLIVIANVANLLLARAVDRRREIAIRLAAGASRAQLIRQFLTESVLLALLGACLGLCIASWTVDSVVWLLPTEIARENVLTFSLDPLTLTLTIGIAIATGLLFGLAPALHAARTDVNTALKEGGRGSGAGVGHHRLRRLLVIGEVSLALVLLVSAGLCAKGLQQARQVDIGFNPDRVLLGHLQIGMNGYNATTALPFYRELRQRLAAEPAIEEAALASWFPLGLEGCKGTGVYVEGYEPLPSHNPTYELAVVSPRYFATLRIPLVTGRDFTDADDAAAPRVAIVNEHFARRFWPGQDPIGRRFRASGEWRTIVGVARAGKYNRLNEEPDPFLFLPYQQGVPDLDLSICVLARGAAESAAAPIRQALRQLDPGVELLRTRTLTGHVAMSFFMPRVASSLLLLLGGVALLLAAMGVYAVIAYAVSQRTREFGVRLALGAQPRDLLAQVLRQGLALGLAGIVVGLGLAVALTRLLQGFLYGVSPFDPLTFALIPALLLGVAGFACVVPARRAMRVDPVEALRAE